jgi:hypothetical protein
VVKLKGPYDIALNKQPDRTFGLTADLWWQGHVEEEVGQNLRQTPPALRRAQSYHRSQEKEVVRSSPASTKRVHQTRAHGGVMNRTIEIMIDPSGEIQINAVGFKGPDREKATKFLEEALGWLAKRSRSRNTTSAAPGSVSTGLGDESNWSPVHNDGWALVEPHLIIHNVISKAA